MANILPESLANSFVAKLRSWLTPEQWQEMRRRNAMPEYRDFGACASHDFCDSNEALIQALESLDYSEYLENLTSDKSLALFNAAWDIARREHLTATE